MLLNTHRQRRKPPTPNVSGICTQTVTARSRGAGAVQESLILNRALVNRDHARHHHVRLGVREGREHQPRTVRQHELIADVERLEMLRLPGLGPHAGLLLSNESVQSAALTHVRVPNEPDDDPPGLGALPRVAAAVQARGLCGAFLQQLF